VARTNNFRKLWDAGILMGGGSDSYVTEINPLLGISAAASHPFPQNSLSVQEAIELFSINGARMGFEEGSKGSLEAGKQADFLVLAADPFDTEPAEIRNIKIEQVYSDGTDVLKQ
jgi:predicted amidohydrolase YtcJ